MKTADIYNYIFFLILAQIFPCDSKPCQNEAVCSNDANNIAEYHCQCKTWFTGKDCEGDNCYKTHSCHSFLFDSLCAIIIIHVKDKIAFI